MIRSAIIGMALSVAPAFLQAEAIPREKLPFIYGAQYYRAPTPARECWEGDLAKIKASGFNTVKYWVQWRWSERREGEYYWKDLDELMVLAHRYGLRVVLNLILDVMPSWVPRDYPDSLMVGFDGRVMSGDPILCRQLGGYPGPCYANDAMTVKRKRFARAAFEHFREAPALLGWDVWNEPETHAMYRGGSRYPYLCYCATCRAKFRGFCERKYGDIGKLNEIWGRCYNDFGEVEVPTMPDCIADFVDWREMQMRQLHEDAEWRLKILKEVDPKSVAHLHIVCSIGGFSPLSGVDDYDCAPSSEIYGSSMVNDPYYCAEGIGSAQGRQFYNAEWHLNWGTHSMFPPVITRDYFHCQQFAQLGWGIFGYLFWQFRTEALGTESPAWGLVNLDGSERPALTYASEFIRAFEPYAKLFMACRTPRPDVVVWRNWANEFHQYARYKSEANPISHYHNGIRSYVETLYSMNVPFGIVTTETLEKGCGDTAKVLVLPQAMYLSDRDAAAIRAFAEKPGSVVVSECNLGAYDRDVNRFSPVVPGKGLAECFGLREIERTAAFHLPNETKLAVSDASDDVSKAMRATGVIGDNYFRLTATDGSEGWGARDFVVVSTNGETEVLAGFHGVPCIVRKGRVFYIGTQLGAAAEEKDKDTGLIRRIMSKAIAAAGICPRPTPEGVHVDYLQDSSGKNRFMIAVNYGKSEQTVRAPDQGWKELFGGPLEKRLSSGAAVVFLDPDGWENSDK